MNSYVSWSMLQSSESVILLSLSAYWFSSLGIHVVLSRMSFCVQIWKMCSAIWCKCGFLLPFSMIVVALKLLVRTSTASCWSQLANDCRQVLMARSSLLVELVPCSLCVNRPWHMMFPSLLNMYPPV